jgi:hypothetical protein
LTRIKVAATRIDRLRIVQWQALRDAMDPTPQPAGLHTINAISTIELAALVEHAARPEVRAAVRH